METWKPKSFEVIYFINTGVFQKDNCFLKYLLAIGSLETGRLSLKSAGLMESA